MSVSVKSISAYSAKIQVLLQEGSPKKKFKYQREHTGSPGLFLTLEETADNEYVMLHLKPNEKYTVRVQVAPYKLDNSKTNWYSVGRDCTFHTEPETEPCLQNMYDSLKTESGIYDTSKLNKELHDIFMKNFSDIVQNGDAIRAPIRISDDNSQIVEATAVTVGNKIRVSEEAGSIFLPFSNSMTPSINDQDHSVTLHNEFDEVVVYYSRDTNTLRCGDYTDISVGDRMFMFNREVLVAEGSMVLVFQDTLTKTYPFSTASAASLTTGSYGSYFTKNLSCGSMNLLGSKTSQTTGSATVSGYVYDSTAGTVSEMTRMVHSVDAAKATGTISLGVLHVDGSNSFIEPVIETTYDSTLITATSTDSQASLGTRFDTTGISFSSSEGSIYFGLNKNFRIKFTDGGASPSTLAIESLNTSTGTYVTRLAFSDGS